MAENNTSSDTVVRVLTDKIKRLEGELMEERSQNLKLQSCEFEHLAKIINLRLFPILYIGDGNNEVSIFETLKADIGEELADKVLRVSYILDRAPLSPEIKEQIRTAFNGCISKWS